MTNKRSPKKAFIASVLSLVLCISVFVGTTFAWFTDSVTNTNNKIVAGNLAVDLELLVEDKWVSLKENNDPIFNYFNWEPGYTDVKILKVENEGSLALKWKALFVSEYELSILADVIDVYVLPSETELSYSDDRSSLDGYKYAGTVAEFVDTIESTTYGVLEAEECAYLGIALKMREEAGNEYQGLDLGGSFDIMIYATQLASEEDSFNDQYDAEAKLPEVVTSDTQLRTAINSGAKTVFLKGDINFTAAAAGKSTDMGGVSIIGIGANPTLKIEGTGGGLTNVSMENIKLVDNTVYTSENGENAWEFTYLEIDGNNTFKNVKFDDGILVEGGHSDFINCSFSGHNNDSSEYGNTTMYGAWVYSGSATFTDCSFFGTRGLKVADQYSGSDVTSVTVDDCVFGPLSEKPGIAVDNRLGALELTVKNSTFVSTQPGDAAQDATKGVPYIYENDNRTPDTTTITLENNVVPAAVTDGNGNVIEGLSKNEATGEYYASTSTAFETAIKNKDAVVNLMTGTYSIGGLAEGVTIIGQGEVTVEDTLSGTMDNTVIKNVTFKSGNAQRWAYSHGDLLFENCTFEATSVYAIHYDGLNNANITYKNCTIIGWVAIGGGANSLTFEGCEIYGNGRYGVIRVYSDTTIKDCTFDVKDVNTTDVYEDGIHAVDCTVNVINCINKNGPVEDLFNISGGVINVQ